MVNYYIYLNYYFYFNFTFQLFEEELNEKDEEIEQVTTYKDEYYEMQHNFFNYTGKQVKSLAVCRNANCTLGDSKETIGR